MCKWEYLIPHFAHGGGHKVEATVGINYAHLIVYVYELCVCVIDCEEKKRVAVARETQRES